MHSPFALVLNARIRGRKCHEHCASAGPGALRDRNLSISVPMAVVIVQAENLCPESVSNESRVKEIRLHAPSAMTSYEAAMTNSAAARGNSKMVTGLFRDSESVERAYEVVSQRGYGPADIDVVMSDDTRRRYWSEPRQINIQLGRKVEEGGELGGPMGGTNA